MLNSRLTQVMLFLIFTALAANLLIGGAGPRPAQAQFAFGFSKSLVEAVQGIADATGRQDKATEKLAAAVRGLEIRLASPSR